MKRVLIVGIVMIFLAFAAKAIVSADDCKGKKGCQGKIENKVEDKARMLLQNKDELGLSDEQVSKIKALKLKTKKDLIQQQAEIDIVALDIKAKLWDEVIDTDAINELIDKKYDFKKAKAKSIVAGYAELKSILTKQQKDKLKELYKGCKIEKKRLHH